MMNIYDKLGENSEQYSPWRHFRIMETSPCRSDPKFPLRNIVKWWEPVVGIDKYEISLFLNILINCCKVSYFYAYLTLFYTQFR